MRRLALGVLMVLAAACSSPGPQLSTLQGEAASLEAVDGLRLAGESEQEQQRGLLGKQTRARVSRTYAVDVDPGEDVARALVEQAAADGWEMPSASQPVLGGLAWRGTKLVEGEELSLTISIITESEVTPQGMQPPVIHLEMVHPYRTS